MSVTIHEGDCRAVMATLPADSVHCVVTSPPYWGLRDYGCDGQIGLEQTPEEYVAEMVAVFREVRRVLRPDGTAWVNLGDSYAGSWGNQGRTEGRGTQRPIRGPAIQSFGSKPHAIDCDMDVDCSCGGGRGKYPSAQSHTGSWVNDHPVLKPKDLVGIPWRVAFALQADGWWLRSDIIWAKPNPMPESVTDRPTKSHEYVFLLAKSEGYFFDADAIAEEATNRPPGNGPDNKHESAYRNGDQRLRTRANLSKIDARQTRNARTVWTIATQPYSGAHFATFPEQLAQRCIMAGCPVGGTVLDPFGGSGTVGRVAEDLGRHSVLIELSPAYAELARRRTAQTGIFPAPGEAAR